MTVLSARIGDIVVGRPPDILEALALGSCVAVFIYDEVSKVGTCAHILLPTSAQFANRDGNEIRPGKYADLAIEESIKLLITKGANREQLKAKITGGAQMFDFSSQVKSALDVGSRNIVAVKEHLKLSNVPIVAEDVGSDYGRTVHFDLEKSMLTIKVGLRKIIRHI